jgi:hypothetical protein
MFDIKKIDQLKVLIFNKKIKMYDFVILYIKTNLINNQFNK